MSSSRTATGLVVCAAIAITLVGAVLLGGGPSHASPPTGEAEAPPVTADDCRQSIAELKVMANQVTDLDAELEAGLAAMTAAPDERRLDALADVVETMIGQRAEMRRVMKGTHQQMMRHVLLHLSIEDGDLRREMMASCPIIQHLRREEPSRGTGVVTQELTY